jgi:hypothetical protein
VDTILSGGDFVLIGLITFITAMLAVVIGRRIP